ncbi:MAG: IF-2 protein [Myxococcota bacterium]|nr:IF-2 protein [Myxococcota bacterium]
MNGNTDSFGVRAKRTATRLMVVLVILGLAGVAAVLLSQLNARTYSLVQEGGALVVMKGRMLPMGSQPFRPSDPALLDAYANIPLEGQGAGSILDRSFSERDELDRALFEVLQRLAVPRLSGSDPAELERGLYYVRRAEKLSGITEEQRTVLKKMQAEVSFYLARTKLDDARKLVAEGLSQLKLASESGSGNARAAHQMIAEVEPSAKALEDSLRRAVHSLSSAPPAEEGLAPTQPPAGGPSAAPQGGSPAGQQTRPGPGESSSASE